MVVSASTKHFERIIQAEYQKLMEKRKNYFLSIYEKISKKKKNSPKLLHFYELLHKDIHSPELLKLACELGNT